MVTRRKLRRRRLRQQAKNAKCWELLGKILDYYRPEAASSQIFIEWNKKEA